jgi:hypothetical protein
MPPNPPNGQKSTQGPVSSVPCPRCGKPNDFREVTSDEDGADVPSDSNAIGADFEQGAIVDCDHCGGKMKILGIVTTVMIKLVPA